MRTVLALAAAVALGANLTPVEEEGEAKLRELRKHDQREHMALVERIRAKRQREIAEQVERERLLAEGIDPTNGRPLSRQQRRFRARRDNVA